MIRTSFESFLGSLGNAGRINLGASFDSRNGAWVNAAACLSPKGLASSLASHNRFALSSWSTIRLVS